MWHNQRPDWLANNPLNFTVSQLNKTIIPNAVQSVIEGLGKNLVSWDVVNEALYFLPHWNHESLFDLSQIRWRDARDECDGVCGERGEASRG